MTATILKTVYRGGRSSCFVFHPAKHWNLETRYNDAKAEFMRMLNNWYEVCELYQDEMTLSENVSPASLKKDVVKMVNEIDDSRDPYLLEGLAEFLWDKEGGIQYEDGSFDGPSEKTQTHFLPTMAEVIQRAAEIKSIDLGIQLPHVTTAKNVSRRTWAG